MITWKSVPTVSQGLSCARLFLSSFYSWLPRFMLKFRTCRRNGGILMIFLTYIATLNREDIDRPFQTTSKENKSITIFNWCCKLSTRSSNLVRIVLIASYLFFLHCSGRVYNWSITLSWCHYVNVNVTCHGVFSIAWSSAFRAHLYWHVIKSNSLLRRPSWVFESNVAVRYLQSCDVWVCSKSQLGNGKFAVYLSID